MKNRPFHVAKQQKPIRLSYKDKNQSLVFIAVGAHSEDHTQYINIPTPVFLNFCETAAR